MVGAIFAVPPVLAGADMDAARALVRTQHLGANFQAMVLTVVSRTVTFTMAAKQVGPPKAFELLQNQMKTLLPKYQAAWDENLAAAYAQNFTPKELIGLSTDGQSSQYYSALKERQAAVGTTMQDLSGELLKKASGEVLSAIWTEVTTNK
jgi:hypothetical protein